MTGNEIIQIDQPGAALAHVVEVGEAANRAAARHAFDDYRSRKAANTLAAQHSDLRLFAAYRFELSQGRPVDDDDDDDASAISAAVDALESNPAAYVGVTWGLVDGFVKWLLARGYAIGTVNHCLATVRVYCKLAQKAGVISQPGYAMIAQVKGYDSKEAKRIDEKRDVARVGDKKAKHDILADDEIADLKQPQGDTPADLRDAAIMAVLLDHGLRVSELTALTVDNVDLKGGYLRFYRPKVDKVDKEHTHRLTHDTARALRRYLAAEGAPTDGALFVGSRKGGRLTGAGMSRQSVWGIVRRAGKGIKRDGLSPHDCRHSWATSAAKNGTNVFALRDAGGWSSLAMPSRYVEAAEVANEGVRLGGSDQPSDNKAR